MGCGECESVDVWEDGVENICVDDTAAVWLFDCKEVLMLAIREENDVGVELKRSGTVEVRLDDIEVGVTDD